MLIILKRAISLRLKTDFVRIFGQNMGWYSKDSKIFQVPTYIWDQIDVCCKLGQNRFSGLYAMKVLEICKILYCILFKLFYKT